MNLASSVVPFTSVEYAVSPPQLTFQTAASAELLFCVSSLIELFSSSTPNFNDDHDPFVIKLEAIASRLEAIPVVSPNGLWADSHQLADRIRVHLPLNDSAVV